MKSPFPGMDPYLEAVMWTDIHHNLASDIQQALMPLIVPRYIAKVEPWTVKDKSAVQDIGVMYPDIALFEAPDYVSEPTSGYTSSTTPATAKLRHLETVEVKIPTIHILDRQDNRLVTAIELLSPANKREPQIHDYRKKRADFRSSGVHLLEIDLIRRGHIPLQHPNLPQSDYRAVLERADDARSEVWAFTLQDPLPILPVPLGPSDPDVAFDLGKALHNIYERNHYYLSLDYRKAPPPPAFGDADTAWIHKTLEKWRQVHQGSDDNTTSTNPSS